MTDVSLSVTGSADFRGLIEFAQKGVGWRRFNARREAFRKQVERRALKVLGAYPPKRSLSRKFRWSNDPIANAKARRWFFANYPDGYSRTGELGRAWKVALSVTVAGFSVSVGNPAKAASYVYGSERYDQVPGHADTGWQQSQDTFLEIAAAAEKLLLNELDGFIREITA